MVIDGETGEVDVKATFAEAFRTEVENNLIQRLINLSHCNEKEVKEMTENKPRSNVVLDENGKIDEVGTVIMQLGEDRPVDWTAIANVPEVFEPAGDITYALEAAKDINVEDAYPNGMNEVFGIDSTMCVAQPTGRLGRKLPTRIASQKVKRGPAKGGTIKVLVRASVVVTMMRVLKERNAMKVAAMKYDVNNFRFMTAEEMNRRQRQMQRDSYRLSSAMNSGDL